MHDVPQAPWKIIGRYAICAEIASGGMATVYFGRLLGPSGFMRTVAIKRLHPHYAGDPEFVSMFLDEARLAARIRHPNVVPTLDVVKLSDELFLVMEYVPGEPLARLFRQLRDQGRLVPRKVAGAVVGGTLFGLHAAHEARDESGAPLNLVHRDVSPQNILVGTDGVARILDFGVAKAAGRAHTTRDGSMKGKCAYMAPEQVHGLPVTRATDLFAAGVVLWELLTGRRLFHAETDASTLMKVLQAEVVAPSAIVPEIPPAWDAVVLQATHRDPARRFATARQMAEAIEACEGICSMTQVAEWVESLASPALAARARLLEAIERTSIDAWASPEARATALPAGRAAAEDQTRPEHTSVEATLSTPVNAPFWPGRGLRRAAPLATVVAVLAVAFVATAVAWGIGSARRSSATAAVAVASPPPPALPLPLPPPGPAPAPAVAVSSSVDTQLVPPVPVPRPETSVAASAPHVRKHSVPKSDALRARADREPAVAGPARPTASSVNPDDCDPPYTIDGDGHRHYKRECLE
jgi:serine/threonine-protein kinase